MLEHERDPKTVGDEEPVALRAEAPAEDAVGYGRPPVGRRFKPGQSGNPNGRPKGSRNAKTVVEKVMNEKVSIREKGRTRKVTKFEAMLQAATMGAMQGDMRALSVVMSVLSRSGVLAEPEAEEAETSLSAGDDAIISDFLRRKTAWNDSDTVNRSENS